MPLTATHLNIWLSTRLHNNNATVTCTPSSCRTHWQVQPLNALPNRQPSRATIQCWEPGASYANTASRLHVHSLCLQRVAWSAIRQKSITHILITGKSRSLLRTHYEIKCWQGHTHPDPLSLGLVNTQRWTNEKMKRWMEGRKDAG